MEFDFRRDLTEEGEIDEEAASIYAEELRERFAESPEGAALADRGIEAGYYLETFLHYALRYIGVGPAEMDPSDVRETLDVMAEKVAARPEDFDQAIPELEAFCDFVDRAFAFKKAADWKRTIQHHAPEFRRAIRDPRCWGMAKSMVMEGLSRGYDLDTEEGIDRWFRTKQAEQIAEIEAERGVAPGWMSLADRLRRAVGLALPDGATDAGEQDTERILVADLSGEPEPLMPGFAATGRRGKKEKSRRKQAKASRRRNRR